jgi:hypothetical protein
MTISTVAPTFPGSSMTADEGGLNRGVPISGAPEVPWVTSDDAVRVPNTSMLPDSTSAGDAWQATAQQAADVAGNSRNGEPQWAEDVRAMVRSSPLAAMIGALVLGVVVSRVVR